MTATGMSRMWDLTLALVEVFAWHYDRPSWSAPGECSIKVFHNRLTVSAILK